MSRVKKIVTEKCWICGARQTHLADDERFQGSDRVMCTCCMVAVVNPRHYPEVLEPVKKTDTTWAEE